MFFLILQWTVISLILIILVHYLYSFFKTTLTVPKIKDLVNRPADAYKEIYEKIEKVKSGEREKLKSNSENEEPIPVNSDAMKDELKSFLNSLGASGSGSDNSKAKQNQILETQDIALEYGGATGSTYGGSSFSTV
jgi:hypothetical protein